MRDWRNNRVKITHKYANTFTHIFYAFAVITIIFLLIFLSSAVKSPHNLNDYINALAVTITASALLYAGLISYVQENTNIELSRLESKRQYLERSLDMYYIPLRDLLLSDDQVKFSSKLGELNCYRYLAKDDLLKKFISFRDKYNETKHLPINERDELLKCVEKRIDDLNKTLCEFYKNQIECSHPKG